MNQPDDFIKSIVQENQPTRPVDLTVEQEALIKKINQADFARLFLMIKGGITDPCIIRDYIPGEAAPLEDRGAVKTFIGTFGIGCYVRTFLNSTGIIGCNLDTIADTTLPGMRDAVVATKESFDPHEYARFVQATVNQAAIRPTRAERRLAMH